MESKTVLIPANKNSQYKIKESEKGFYHLRLVDEYPTADPRTVLAQEKIQIFSVAGFRQFLANNKHFNFKTGEIIHDPTLTAKQAETKEQEQMPAVVETNEPEQQTTAGAAIPTEKPKKVFTGSQAWRNKVKK